MKKIKNILSVIIFALSVTFAPAMFASQSANDTFDTVGDINPEPQIKVLDQRIEIEIADENEHSILVYALTGQIVKSVKATYGTTTIELPAGYYIVKIDRTAKRVIVR